jgi:signal transduction histidine kinase
LDANVIQSQVVGSDPHRLGRQTMMLDLVQRVAQTGCWEIDVNSDRAWWSDELQRILEVPQGEYQPTSREFVGLLTPRGSHTVAAAVAAAIKSGTPFDLDVQVLSMKGRPLWLRVAGRQDRDVSGGTQLFGTVQNITDQHLLEQAVVDGPRQVRRRITLDLHDGLGLKLMEIEALVAALGAAARADGSPLAARLDVVADRVRDAVGACRAVAHGLATVTQQHGGLIPALEELAARARLAENAEVVLLWRAPGRLALPNETVEHLYQIAQQAVMNALRARASRIGIELAVQRRELKLSISSSGAVGADAADAAAPRAEPAEGFMRHRARLIGGALRVTDHDGGLRVTCVLRRGRA